MEVIRKGFAEAAGIQKYLEQLDRRQAQSKRSLDDKTN